MSVPAGSAPDGQLREAARRRVAPIVDWLPEERLKIGRGSFLFSRYRERLRELGVPLDRATVHMPQLHPRLAARALPWTREADAAGGSEPRHGAPDRGLRRAGAGLHARVPPARPLPAQGHPRR